MMKVEESDGFLVHNTKWKTIQLSDDLEGDLLVKGFMLRDLIVSNNSPGKVTVLVTDGERTHIIAVLASGVVFNHSFVGGWTSWRGARLRVLKEALQGLVDVSVGYVNASVQDYSIWRIE